MPFGDRICPLTALSQNDWSGCLYVFSPVNSAINTWTPVFLSSHENTPVCPPRLNCWQYCFALFRQVSSPVALYNQAAPQTNSSLYPFQELKSYFRMFIMDENEYQFITRKIIIMHLSYIYLLVKCTSIRDCVSIFTSARVCKCIQPFGMI